MAADDAHPHLAADLAAIDAEARALGQHPLSPATIRFRLQVRQAVRARHAALDEHERRREAARPKPADHEAAVPEVDPFARALLRRRYRPGL